MVWSEMRGTWDTLPSRCLPNTFTKNNLSVIEQELISYNELRMANIPMPKCINNRSCSRLCSTPGCTADPVICLNPGCQCLTIHRNCPRLIYWQDMVNLIQDYQNLGNNKYANYMHLTLDQLLIDFIRLLQQELVAFREQKVSVGLGPKERELLRRLKKNERLSSQLVGQIVDGVGRNEPFASQYPIKEHQNSVKVIRHTITNLMSMFKEAFSLRTMAYSESNNSFDTNNRHDFSGTEPEQPKLQNLSAFNLSGHPDGAVKILHVEDFGSVSGLTLKSCIPQKLKLSAELFSDLLRLDLQDCGLNEVTVKNVASFKRVQCLNLYGNKIMDNGLIYLSQHMKRLRSLGLRNTGVTDRGIITMSTSLPLVQQLFLGDNKVGQDGLQMVSQHCRNLITIFLCNIPLGDKVITMFLSGCSPLQVLSLKNTGINDLSVQILVKYHPGLFALYLGDNNLTDVSCQQLTQCCSLQALFLCGNKLTLKGVKTIVQGTRTLQVLGIRNMISQSQRAQMAHNGRCKVIA